MYKKENMRFNNYDLFNSLYSHQYVSASILAIFRVMFLLQECNC